MMKPISYYIHGKDNIPFHTIILPSLLKGARYCLNFLINIVSSDMLPWKEREISTSNNWAVWVPVIIEKYNIDSLRVFFS